MPHMREGPDTWRVSQTRRRVESSVLSPFNPLPAPGNGSHPDHVSTPMYGENHPPMAHAHSPCDILLRLFVSGNRNGVIQLCTVKDVLHVDRE
eukprot:scaffold9173_cov28-Phaeocystis_antarctica.AAC.1